MDYSGIVEAAKWKAEQKAKRPTVGSALGTFANSAVSTYISGKEQEKKSAIEASAEERKTMATFANDLFQNYMPVRTKDISTLTPEEQAQAKQDPTMLYDPIPAEQFPQIFNYMRKQNGQAPAGVTFIPKNYLKADTNEITVTPGTQAEVDKLNAQMPGYAFKINIATKIPRSSYNVGLQGANRTSQINQQGAQAEKLAGVKHGYTMEEIQARVAAMKDDKDVQNLNTVIDNSRNAMTSAEKNPNGMPDYLKAKKDMETAAEQLGTKLGIEPSEVVNIVQQGKWLIFPTSKTTPVAMTASEASLYKEAEAIQKGAPEYADAQAYIAKMKAKYGIK